MKKEVKEETVIDLELGRRLKLFRQMKGISKRELADFFSVTIQQLDKYENGTNRISSSKLFIMINYFCINPLYFFNNYDNFAKDDDNFTAEEKSSIQKNKEKIQELICYFSNVNDEEAQQIILELTKSLVKKIK